MHPTRRTLMAAAALLPGAASAQSLGGAGPIRLVVPFAPGGSIDVLARLVAPLLRDQLQQDVLVDNRTGAAGLIAAENVVQSPPNGHSLLVASGGQVTIAAALPQQLNFQPMRDLVAFARANPGKVTYASSGIGSVTHLMMELLNQRTGAKFEHVPYRGTAPATADLASGRVDMTLASLASVKPMLDRGELRPIATATAARIPQLPDVPTAAEEGITGMDAPVWVGLVTRAGTPDAVIARLDEALRKVMTNPTLLERLDPLGMAPVAQGPAAFTATLQADAALWKEAVARGNITLN